MAPITASAYPNLMKIKVGLTVNIVCSRSSDSLERSGTPPCVRAILVASGSFAGEPQPEQKRTPGAMYVPQLEQCILINCLLLMGRVSGSASEFDQAPAKVPVLGSL